MSDRLPPPAAARIAEAAAFSSGNSPIAIQSWWPKVRYHPMSLPPTLLKSLATAFSRFSGFASMPLTAAEVKQPREMQRLRRNTQNLTQQLRTFANPIVVRTTVIRMKDCRIRNEMRQLLHYPVQHPADAVQEHGTVTGGRMVFRGLATNPLNRLSPKPALTRISAAH